MDAGFSRSTTAFSVTEYSFRDGFGNCLVYSCLANTQTCCSLTFEHSFVQNDYLSPLNLGQGLFFAYFRLRKFSKNADFSVQVK